MPSFSTSSVRSNFSAISESISYTSGDGKPTIDVVKLAGWQSSTWPAWDGFAAWPRSVMYRCVSDTSQQFQPS